MRKRIVLIISLVGLAILVLGIAACRPKVYTDGTFQAVSQANARGYAWARVTIARDRITRVELKEFDGTGREKDWATYPHPAAKQAWEQLPARFVAKNGWDVDIIAGATSSSNKYKEAVKLALERAKARPTVTTAYFGGTFMGVSDAGAQGWGVAWVTIENDRITKVEVTDVTAEGALKDWDNYPHQAANAARAVMAQRFVAAGPAGAAGVDVVAGATGSSNNWKQAVQRALTAARVK